MQSSAGDGEMNMHRSDLPTVRDLADALFRRKWFLAISTFLLAAFVGAAWFYTAGTYEAQMVLLVRNNRAEVVVTPGQASGAVPQAGLTEGQIATEVQILMSRNSLRQVVRRAGLVAAANGGAEAAERTALALEKQIKVAPNVKAGLIVVRYSHKSPEQAARVLRELLALYTDRHIQVHKGGGTDFFERQSAQQAERLREAQQKLAEFQKSERIFLLNEQKDINLRKAMELEAAHRESQLAFREGRERVAALEQMVRSLTPRITTQVRNIPNQALAEKLQTMLAELGNRRTDLLAKFRSDDRLVQQIDQQIAGTRATLEQALKATATEQATDVNPLRQSLDGDLARARMNQQVLKARIATLGAQIGDYKKELAALEESTAAYNELLREVRTLEENHLLYARKWEESRIADALDSSKIANVTVVEAPEAPTAPLQRSLLLPFGAFLLGFGLLVCVALLSGLHGQRLYTPRAIFLASGIEVLATVPRRKQKR
jgi:polysaccharide biosynthesis transport protein